MKCERCDTPSRVISSRAALGTMRRRRACPSCGRRWSTFEIRCDRPRHGAAIIAAAEAANAASKKTRPDR